MNIRTLEPFTYHVGTTHQEVRTLVESCLFQPDAAGTNDYLFSLWDYDTDAIVLDRQAGAIADITTEVDPCTGISVWSFKLSYTFLVGDTSGMNGHYYYRWRLLNTPGIGLQRVYDIPGDKRMKIAFIGPVQV